MPQAFDVDPDDKAIVTQCGVSTVPIEAHKALDDLLNIVQKTGGGEVLLIDKITRETYRLTFCNYTGLTECDFCNGTGARQK